MDPIVTLAAIVLVFLLTTAVLGVLSLRAWLRHGSASLPVAKVVTHVVLQVVSMGLWIAFIVTGEPWIAWTTFVIITAGQTFGDLLMFASYRARRNVTRVSNYVVVAKDLLSFSRPVPALHAIVGALGWFGMIAVCVWSVLR